MPGVIDARTVDTQVIVVGAGPVGLVAAIELRRRGVDVLIIDKRESVAPWAKAVGIQPRTLEIWDQVGMVEPVLSASLTMRGQVMYVNGERAGELAFPVPDQVPYGFICLPQHATEELLGAHLTSLGATVSRGVELVDVAADDAGVTATLRDADGDRRVSAEYLVSAEGAHSLVRKAMGLTFEGDAFPEEYMLADVELDWSVPPDCRCAARMSPMAWSTTSWCASRYPGGVATASRCWSPTNSRVPLPWARMTV